MYKSLKNTIYYCIGIILFAVILQLISSSINQELFFPNVGVMFSKFFELLKESKTYVCIFNTIKHLVISVVLSILIGSSLGILAGINDRVYLILKPIMTFLRILPIIVFIVILSIILAFDNVPIIACILIVVPMFYEGTYQGIKKLDSALLDVYKLNSRLSLRVILNVHLPLISSNLKTVFINSIGMGIKVIVTTEYFAGINNTLGKAIIDSTLIPQQYSDIYGYSFILILVVLVIEALPKLIIYLFNTIKYKPLKK